MTVHTWVPGLWPARAELTSRPSRDRRCWMALTSSTRYARPQRRSADPAPDDEAELGIDDEVEDIDLNEANLGNDTDVAS